MTSYHPENDPANPDRPVLNGEAEPVPRDMPKPVQGNAPKKDAADAVNPDPADGDIPGLEPGGGVPPGETPPASDQMGADEPTD